MNIAENTCKAHATFLQKFFKNSSKIFALHEHNVQAKKKNIGVLCLWLNSEISFTFATFSHSSFKSGPKRKNERAFDYCVCSKNIISFLHMSSCFLTKWVDISKYQKVGQIRIFCVKKVKLNPVNCLKF